MFVLNSGTYFRRSEDGSSQEVLKNSSQKFWRPDVPVERSRCRRLKFWRLERSWHLKTQAFLALTFRSSEELVQKQKLQGQRIQASVWLWSEVSPTFIWSTPDLKSAGERTGRCHSTHRTVIACPPPTSFSLAVWYYKIATPTNKTLATATSYALEYLKAEERRKRLRNFAEIIQLIRTNLLALFLHCS